MEGEWYPSKAVTIEPLSQHMEVVDEMQWWRGQGPEMVDFHKQKEKAAAAAIRKAEREAARARGEHIESRGKGRGRQGAGKGRGKGRGKGGRRAKGSAKGIAKAAAAVHPAPVPLGALPLEDAPMEDEEDELNEEHIEPECGSSSDGDSDHESDNSDDSDNVFWKEHFQTWEDVDKIHTDFDKNFGGINLPQDEENDVDALFADLPPGNGPDSDDHGEFVEGAGEIPEPAKEDGLFPDDDWPFSDDDKSPPGSGGDDGPLTPLPHAERPERSADVATGGAPGANSGSGGHRPHGTGGVFVQVGAESDSASDDSPPGLAGPDCPTCPGPGPAAAAASSSGSSSGAGPSGSATTGAGGSGGSAGGGGGGGGGQRGVGMGCQRDESNRLPVGCTLRQYHQPPRPPYWKAELPLGICYAAGHHSRCRSYKPGLRDDESALAECEAWALSTFAS